MANVDPDRRQRDSNGGWGDRRSEATNTYEEEEEVVGLREEKFVHEILRQRGCWILLIVTFLLALGIGSVIGLVPDTAADRYARVRHLYNGTFQCSHYDRVHMPPDCQRGSDDAQYSATLSNCAMNLLSFLLNPVLGSLSDAHGRKPVILLSLAVSALPAAVLVALIQTPALRPVWYYAVNATGGPTYFLGVAFATLSDVFPRQKFRASSYGLLLACFYGGYALGPSLSLVLSSWGVASASFGLMMAAFWVAILFLPETLSTGVGVSSVRRTQGGEQQQPSPGRRRRCVTLLVRPFRELSILNRSPAIRLVALGSFFSSMVYASDVTLVVYYIIEQLNVRDADLAQMFLIMGAVGIVFQGGLLPSLIKRFGGEFRLLVATFACGVVHNTLYGLATGKRTILLALLLAQFTKLNFPILSSIASQMVSSREQGRMQGAMFATNALASAFGPLSMEYVYGKTKSRSPETWYGGGPGTMFFYAALLQVLGTVTVSCIPRSASRAVIPHDEPEPRRPQPDSSLEFEEEESLLATTAASDLAEPLLSANCVDPRVI